jgi:AraC-like DNA-binding protein
MVPPFLSTPCKWQNNSQRTWPNQTVRAVKEIAASCGFSSSEIMRRTFLTAAGYTQRFSAPFSAP